MICHHKQNEVKSNGSQPLNKVRQNASALTIASGLKGYE